MHAIAGFFVALFWVIVAIIVIKWIANNPESGTDIGNAFQGLVTWIENIVTSAVGTQLWR